MELGCDLSIDGRVQCRGTCPMRSKLVNLGNSWQCWTSPGAESLHTERTEGNSKDHNPFSPKGKVFRVFWIIWTIPVGSDHYRRIIDTANCLVAWRVRGRQRHRRSKTRLLNRHVLFSYSIETTHWYISRNVYFGLMDKSAQSLSYWKNYCWHE